MRKEPHGSVGLGSLSLQEFSQQPLHLPVSGVCTFHRLLRVKTLKKRTRHLLHNAGWRYEVLRNSGAQGENPRNGICCVNKPETGINEDSALMSGSKESHKITENSQLCFFPLVERSQTVNKS